MTSTGEGGEGVQAGEEGLQVGQVSGGEGQPREEEEGARARPRAARQAQHPGAHARLRDSAPRLFHATFS